MLKLKWKLKVSFKYFYMQELVQLRRNSKIFSSHYDLNQRFSNFSKAVHSRSLERKICAHILLRKYFFILKLLLLWFNCNN